MLNSLSPSPRKQLPHTVIPSEVAASSLETGGDRIQGSDKVATRAGIGPVPVDLPQPRPRVRANSLDAMPPASVPAAQAHAWLTAEELAEQVTRSATCAQSQAGIDALTLQLAKHIGQASWDAHVFAEVIVAWGQTVAGKAWPPQQEAHALMTAAGLIFAAAFKAVKGMPRGRQSAMETLSFAKNILFRLLGYQSAEANRLARGAIGTYLTDGRVTGLFSRIRAHLMMANWDATYPPNGAATFWHQEEALRSGFDLLLDLLKATGVAGESSL